ncbi:DUF2213 domain-containing protein [Deferribacter autotrophicus]|uniref:DUF2213 domain-containing protein n=1 Tax=Deferribacter autotrophicus TaxID=500465 RepID=A0A5A8F3Y3_9BACT|nr:DUF2213 domain-containing protein [Deferribacter autotrophicus]KAA0257204.1 DUF2213 domain-containing protein [Deferribacter autotrophicus]
MPKDMELLYSRDLSNFEEDENYVYVDAVVLVPGTIKRNYGDLIIEADELKRSAEGLKGKPVLIEHQNDVNSVVGQVIESFFDDDTVQLKAKLKILKKGNDKLIQLIKDKIVTKLSAGFRRTLEQVKAGMYRAKDIEFQEVSIVLNSAVDQATILKKEVIDMPDIESLTKEKTLLEKEVETLKRQLVAREEKIEELTEKLSVLEKEIEALKGMAEIGKKYEESLIKDAEKFVKVVEGDDSPILSLIGKAEIDELQAIARKYEALAREKLKNTAKGTDDDTEKDELNLDEASYEDLKKYEEKLLIGGN